jgi:hypothetical protein
MDNIDVSSESSIKEAIEKTGLPTEIKVTNLLKAEKWLVFNEYPFLDLEENKIRTLDIRATNVFFTKKYDKKKNPIHAFLELYIECKKSIKEAWVFHVADFQDNPESFSELFLKRLVEKLKLARPSKTAQEPLTLLSKIPLLYDQQNIKHKIALSHQVIGGKDFLFEAYMQLLKALSYGDAEKTNSSSSLTENLVIPIIIFDGSMYECYFKEGQLQTPKTNFVRSLVYALSSQKLPAMIDIVTLNFLPQYLKMLEKEFPNPKVEITF